MEPNDSSPLVFPLDIIQKIYNHSPSPKVLLLLFMASKSIRDRLSPREEWAWEGLARALNHPHTEPFAKRLKLRNSSRKPWKTHFCKLLYYYDLVSDIQTTLTEIEHIADPREEFARIGVLEPRDDRKDCCYSNESCGKLHVISRLSRGILWRTLVAEESWLNFCPKHRYFVLEKLKPDYSSPGRLTADKSVSEYSPLKFTQVLAALGTTNVTKSDHAT